MKNIKHILQCMLEAIQQALEEIDENGWLPYPYTEPEAPDVLPFGKPPDDEKGSAAYADWVDQNYPCYLIIRRNAETPDILHWTGNEFVDEFGVIDDRVYAWQDLPEKPQFPPGWNPEWKED